MSVETITVRHASVVFVSPSPVDPQTIRPDALTNAQVVPPGWALGNQINTPVLAVAQYQNGLSVQTEGNRCVFQEVVGGPIRPSYEVHQLARRYLEATKLVAYNAVGVNWLLDLAVNDPVSWFRNRFGESVDFSDFSPVSLQISKPVSTGVCNLIFRVDQGPRSVVLDCNYHFQLNSGLQPMSALDHWQHCQNRLVEDILPSLH